MKKKIPLYYLLIAIALFSILSLVLHQRTTNLEKRINGKFRLHIDQLQADFGHALGKSPDEDAKIYQFTKIASDTAIAMDLCLMTPYNDRNKYLYPALNSLYLCMTMEGSRKNLVLERERVYKYFYDLSLNPEDTEAARELHELASKIYLDVKK